MPNEAKSFATTEGVKTPIFWGHGTGDKIVDFKNQVRGLQPQLTLNLNINFDLRQPTHPAANSPGSAIGIGIYRWSVC